MKTEKVPWAVGRRCGCRRDLAEGEGMERKRRKTCFSAGRTVYVYYFKDIRQGRYSQILLGLEMRLSWGLVGVYVGKVHALRIHRYINNSFIMLLSKCNSQ